MNAPTSAFWIQLFGIVAVEVTVAMGLAALVQWLTKSAVWRRMIWQVVSVSLAMLVVFELVGVGRGLVGWMGSRLPARAEAPAPVQPQAARRAAGDAVVFPAITESARLPAASAVPDAQIVSTMAARSLSAPNTLVNWLPGLVWLLGFSVLGGRVLLGQLMLEWFRRRCQNVDDESLRERLRELSLRLGIRKRIRLVESAKIQGLIAFGLLRPAIGLPARFAQNFSAPQQEAMLAHELAHLSAHDPAWHLLADWLAAALWWHPLVWWSRQQFLKASEAVADESSLLVADGPQVLADCLVKLGARLTHPQPFGWTGIGGKGFKSGLAQRVERLIRLSDQTWQPPNRISFASAKIAGPLAVTVVAMLCTAWAGPEPLQKTNHEETVMKKIQKSWKRSAAALTLAAVLNTANTPARADDSPKLAVREPSEIGTQTAFNSPTLVPGPETKGVQAMKAKLERIIFPQVSYDGLPLAEVIKHLIDESAKRDPDKLGINFMISNTLDASPRSVMIDPATGLPLPASPTEPIDVDAITVKIYPPLKQVRMIDVLDAITKVADRPIKYSIEEYAVIFSQGSMGPADPIASRYTHYTPPDSGALAVRTFKVDTNTFFSGAKKIFDVTETGHWQADLRQLLTRLGLNMNAPNKTVFYNDRSGVLMVRATVDELAIVEAAMETLGGSAEGRSRVSAAVAGKPGAAVEDAVAKFIQALGDAIPPAKK